MTDKRPKTVQIPQPMGIYANELFERGKEFWYAFNALSQNKGDKISYPEHFLAAHTLELFLKAFLAAKGIKKTELKKLGHNLVKLNKKCEELKIPSIDKFGKFCENIHRMNEDFDLRYPSGYCLTLPTSQLYREVIETLIKQIAQHVKHASDRDKLAFAFGKKHAEAGIPFVKGGKTQWSD